MAEVNKNDTEPPKIVRPIKRGRHRSQENASGVPGRGGSRQGNIGHQANDNSDNSHR